MKTSPFAACLLLALPCLAVRAADEVVAMEELSIPDAATITHQERIIPKAEDAAILLPAHDYSLSTKAPSFISLCLQSPASEAERVQLAQYYGVSRVPHIYGVSRVPHIDSLESGTFWIGFGWSGQSGRQTGQDILSQKHDGKGKVSSSFSKFAASCCAYDYLKGISETDIKDIRNLPLIDIKGEGWRISYSTAWRRYLLAPKDIEHMLNEQGQLIQELELQSPQGECITLRFGLAYRDGLGQLYGLSWSPRGCAIHTTAGQRGFWKVHNPKGDFQAPAPDAEAAQSQHQKQQAYRINKQTQQLQLRYPEEVVLNGMYLSCSGSLQPEPISYTEDRYHLTRSPQLKLDFEKHLVRKSGKEAEILRQSNLPDEESCSFFTQYRAIAPPPFLSFSAADWRIEDDTQWIELYAREGQVAQLRQPNGRIEQTMTLISPKGERIELRFIHSTIDSQGNEWSPTWGLFKIGNGELKLSALAGRVAKLMRR